MARLSGLASPHCLLCGTGLLSRDWFLGLELPPPPPPLILSGTARLCGGMEAADADMLLPAAGAGAAGGGC